MTPVLTMFMPCALLIAVLGVFNLTLPAKLALPVELRRPLDESIDTFASETDSEVVPIRNEPNWLIPLH